MGMEENYMVFDCRLEVCVGVDTDFNTPTYASVVTVKCFKTGSRIYIREANSDMYVNGMEYWVKNEIHKLDKIDGQIIKSVEPVPDFDGTVSYYIAKTW